MLDIIKLQKSCFEQNTIGCLVLMTVKRKKYVTMILSCEMYGKVKSIVFASEVKIDALSGNIILDIKCFSITAESTLQTSFEPSV